MHANTNSFSCSWDKQDCLKIPLWNQKRVFKKKKVLEVSEWMKGLNTYRWASNGLKN